MDERLHVVETALDGVNVNPSTVALIAVGVLALLWLMRQSGGRTVKDPTRAFSADQRRAGFRRASDQCEFSTPWLTRCVRTSSHADHFFPHAKGGASTMRNLVAACPTHNLSKGAKLPSRFERALIQARRRRYFPQHADRTAGEWYR